jgi:hypothetical protein
MDHVALLPEQPVPFLRPRLPAAHRGTAALGLHAWLFPYDRGDCADYSTWLLADKGIKRERTGLRPSDLRRILDLLGADGRADLDNPTIAIGREGHVYVSASRIQG